MTWVLTTHFIVSPLPDGLNSGERFESGFAHVIQDIHPTAPRALLDLENRLNASEIDAVVLTTCKSDQGRLLMQATQSSGTTLLTSTVSLRHKPVTSFAYLTRLNTSKRQTTRLTTGSWQRKGVCRF